MILELFRAYLLAQTEIMAIVTPNNIKSIASNIVSTSPMPVIILNIISNPRMKTYNMRECTIQVSIWDTNYERLSNLAYLIQKNFEDTFYNDADFNYTTSTSINIDILNFNIIGERTLKENDSELIQVPLTVDMVYRIN
jgi:hypothetical protein